MVVARIVGATEWYVDDSPHLAELHREICAGEMKNQAGEQVITQVVKSRYAHTGL